MDRVLDFVQGTDKIDLTGLGYTGVSLTGSGTVLDLTISTASNRTYVHDAGTFQFYLDGQYTLTGSDFTDTSFA